MIANLDFGDFDAKTDKIRYSDELFVRTRQHKAFELPQHRIIFGRKGSGKTALVQHIIRKNRERFAHIINIDADDIRYKPLTKEFNNIYDCIGGSIELRKSFANIWEYSIITTCMIKVLKSARTNEGDGAIIHNYLRKENLLEKRVYDVLLGTFENLFKIAMGKSGEPIANIIRAIDNYPLEVAGFDKAKLALSKLINNGHKCLITFDRIDTYFEIEPENTLTDYREREALRFFLSGLTQAVYNLSTDSLFRDNLQFKVFLPLDRYDSVKSRDWDKIKKFVYKINWSHNELVEFVALRIAESLNIRDENGELEKAKSFTWHKVFDSTVNNTTINNIPEDIDRYLIRHSHYKPRDLQYFCLKAKEISVTNAENTGFPISQKIIRQAVREMTIELVDNFFLEYQYEIPYLKKLIHSFRRHINIFNYNNGSTSLWNTLSKFKSKEKIDEDVEKLISLLYGIGFLGAVTINKKDDVTKELPYRKVKGVEYWFRFSCFDPVFDLFHANKIVIHPMFNEYLHLDINKHVIVG